MCDHLLVCRLIALSELDDTIQDEDVTESLRLEDKDLLNNENDQERGESVSISMFACIWHEGDGV